MLSELQTQKFKFQFDLLDANGDGQIEEADFVRIAELLIEDRGWEPESKASARLRRQYLDGWKVIYDACDQDQDQKVSLEEWLHFHTKMLEDDRQNRIAQSFYRSPIEQISNFLFDLFDTNGDQQISREEHASFCRSLGLTAEQIESSFDRIDIDGNGLLDREEVLDMILEFYFSDDPNVVGNWIFGPFQTALVE